MGEKWRETQKANLLFPDFFNLSLGVCCRLNTLTKSKLREGRDLLAYVSKSWFITEKKQEPWRNATCLPSQWVILQKIPGIHEIPFSVCLKKKGKILYSVLLLKTQHSDTIWHLSQVQYKLFWTHNSRGLKIANRYYRHSSILECSTCKVKYLGLVSRTHIKCCALWLVIVISSLGRERKGDSWGILANQPSLFGISRPVKDPISKSNE